MNRWTSVWGRRPNLAASRCELTPQPRLVSEAAGRDEVGFACRVGCLVDNNERSREPCCSGASCSWRHPRERAERVKQEEREVIATGSVRRSHSSRRSLTKRTFPPCTYSYSTRLQVTFIVSNTPSRRSTSWWWRILRQRGPSCCVSVRDGTYVAQCLRLLAKL